MKAHELRERIKNILAAGGDRISLIPDPDLPMPKGFPRGELLTINPTTKERVYSYDAAKVLAWLDENMPVEQPQEVQP